MASKTLAYDRPRHTFSGESRRRFLLWAAIPGLLGAIMAAIGFYPVLKFHVGRYLAQCACLSYTSPDDAVVYNDGRWSANRFLAAYDKQSGGAAPALFMHARSCNAGDRLVTLRVVTESDGGRWLRFIAEAEPKLSPTKLDQPGWYAGLRSDCGLVLVLKPTDHIQFLAGQPDPSDSAHFTVAYVINGSRGVLDGRLAPSGSISIRPRVGPTTWAPDANWTVWTPTGAPIPDSVLHPPPVPEILY